jgi:hypothetical protein
MIDVTCDPLFLVLTILTGILLVALFMGWPGDRDV